MELKVLAQGTLTEILNTTIAYSLMIAVAVAASQIETAMFLKTLNTNTMMTTLAQPSTKQSKLECYLLTPKAFYQFTIPCMLVLVIVLGVIGYALFRSRQIRKTRANEDHFSFEGAGNDIEVRDNGSPSQDGLFTIQDAISEINRYLKENGATPIRNVEEDVFVEDTELVTLSSSTMVDKICQMLLNFFFLGASKFLANEIVKK